MNVLYSAIFGGSDTVKKAPVGPDRCVLFTDNPTLQGSLGWDVRVQPSTPFPRKQARLVKMSSDRLFPDADVVVWADGSIAISDWGRLVKDTGTADVACLPHPDRSNCYDEGETVIRLKIGGRVNVTRALEAFKADGFAPDALSTTGLFVRRSTPAVVEMNRLWLEHLERYGINDQVHLDYCAWKAGCTREWLTGNYLANPYMVYDRLGHRQHRRPQYLPDPS